LKEFLKYDKNTILRDKSRDGLFVNFIRKYEAEFGEKVIVGCGACLAKMYNNFINKYMSTDKKEISGYVLKLKYNGIKSKTTGRPCRNEDLTEKQAIDLIEKHPHGANLFDKIPDSYYKSIEVVETEQIETTKEVKTPQKDIKRTSKKRK